MVVGVIHTTTETDMMPQEYEHKEAVTGQTGFLKVETQSCPKTSNDIGLFEAFKKTTTNTKVAAFLFVFGKFLSLPAVMAAFAHIWVLAWCIIGLAFSAIHIAIGLCTAIHIAIGLCIYDIYKNRKTKKKSVRELENEIQRLQQEKEELLENVAKRR